MKAIYIEGDDILKIRVSNKPITCEASQDWHTHISYTEDGLLDKKKVVFLPLN